MLIIAQLVKTCNFCTQCTVVRKFLMSLLCLCTTPKKHMGKWR